MYGDGKIVIEKITIYDTKVFLVEMRLDLKKNFGLLSLEQPCLNQSNHFFIFVNIILSIHLVSLKNNQKYDIWSKSHRTVKQNNYFSGPSSPTDLLRVG